MEQHEDTNNDLFRKWSKLSTDYGTHGDQSPVYGLVSQTSNKREMCLSIDLDRYDQYRKQIKRWSSASADTASATSAAASTVDETALRSRSSHAANARDPPRLDRSPSAPRSPLHHTDIHEGSREVVLAGIPTRDDHLASASASRSDESNSAILKPPSSSHGSSSNEGATSDNVATSPESLVQTTTNTSGAQQQNCEKPVPFSNSPQQISQHLRFVAEQLLDDIEVLPWNLCSPQVINAVAYIAIVLMSIGVYESAAMLFKGILSKNLSTTHYGAFSMQDLVCRFSLCVISPEDQSVALEHLCRAQNIALNADGLWLSYCKARLESRHTTDWAMAYGEADEIESRRRAAGASSSPIHGRFLKKVFSPFVDAEHPSRGQKILSHMVDRSDREEFHKLLLDIICEYSTALEDLTTYQMEISLSASPAQKVSIHSPQRSSTNINLLNLFFRTLYSLLGKESTIRPTQHNGVMREELLFAVCCCLTEGSMMPANMTHTELVAKLVNLSKRADLSFVVMKEFTKCTSGFHPLVHCIRSHTAAEELLKVPRDMLVRLLSIKFEPSRRYAATFPDDRGTIQKELDAAKSNLATIQEDGGIATNTGESLNQGQKHVSRHSLDSLKGPSLSSMRSSWSSSLRSMEKARRHMKGLTAMAPDFDATLLPSSVMRPMSISSSLRLLLAGERSVRSMSLDCESFSRMSLTRSEEFIKTPSIRSQTSIDGFI